MADRGDDALTARSTPVLPLFGVLAGIWGMMPRFIDSGLLTDDRVEVIDHVVPGVVVVIVSLMSLAARRPAKVLFFFLTGLVVLLAGLFMLSTHVPLIMQAIRGEAPWGGAIFHTAPAVGVLGLGLLWSWACWSATADPQANMPPDNQVGATLPDLSDRSSDG